MPVARRPPGGARRRHGARGRRDARTRRGGAGGGPALLRPAPCLLWSAPLLWAARAPLFIARALFFTARALFGLPACRLGPPRAPRRAPPRRGRRVPSGGPAPSRPKTAKTGAKHARRTRFAPVFCPSGAAGRARPPGAGPGKLERPPTGWASAHKNNLPWWRRFSPLCGSRNRWPKNSRKASIFIALHSKAIKATVWAVPAHDLKILSASPRSGRVRAKNSRTATILYSPAASAAASSCAALGSTLTDSSAALPSAPLTEKLSYSSRLTTAT